MSPLRVEQATKHFINISKAQAFTPFKLQKDSLKKANEIILDNHNNDMIHKGFRTNHTVHAILSLYQMGAPPELLVKQYEMIKTELEPLSKVKYTINDENYKNYIGDKSAYSSYLKFFDEKVKDLGRIEALLKYVPNIIPGLTGAALHPLIHLGYSVEFENSIVASEGLAYAYSHYLRHGEVIDLITPKNDIESIEEKLKNLNIEDSKHPKIHTKTAYLILHELKNIGAKPYNEEKSLLSDRINNIVEAYSNQLLEIISKFGVNEDNIEELSKDLAIGTVEIFGGSYRQGTLDFFLLHTLTGNHGVRTLLPLFEPKQQVRLLNINFLALSLLFLTQGAPNPTIISTKLHEELDGALNKPETWGKAFIKAGESLDSHVIKGVRNLYQLQEKYGPMDDLFFRPATYLALDIPKNDWNFLGIGRLPEQ